MPTLYSNAHGTMLGCKGNFGVLEMPFAMNCPTSELTGTARIEFTTKPP
jgi:hypothetical protein